ncbi:MAG: dTDP-4-dehydrorhamnose reductase [Solirubrobacterales bacterium]|jgi:dTDP-4-dehydrorhamnose reductase|nr:dTDP-4-dehydrorhamnose reductase [Solirubrobacterales bacterium]
MLGQDLVDACVGRGQEVFALAKADLDVTDEIACEDVMTQLHPDAVVNCAAWTDVDGAETEEAAAMAVNELGAGHLAAAAGRHGARVAYVSSDYVFDGQKGTPYVESDLLGPLSAYGRSKAAGETATAFANDRHMVVRSSWLFGTRGGNFVETMLRIGSEQPEVVVVSDQVGAPTYTRHLAAALAELIETDQYGIHHVAAAGECSWFDYAQEIFDLEDCECRVMAGTTEMLGRPAPRPAYSVLGSERHGAPVLPEWRDGLRQYLRERASIGG